MSAEQTSASESVPYQLISKKELLKREAFWMADTLQENLAQIQNMMSYPEDGATHFRLGVNHVGTVKDNYEVVFNYKVNQLFTHLTQAIGGEIEEQNRINDPANGSSFDVVQAIIQNNANALRNLGNML